MAHNYVINCIYQHYAAPSTQGSKKKLIVLLYRKRQPTRLLTLFIYFWGVRGVGQYSGCMYFGLSVEEVLVWVQGTNQLITNHNRVILAEFCPWFPIRFWQQQKCLNWFFLPKIHRNVFCNLDLLSAKLRCENGFLK